MRHHNMTVLSASMLLLVALAACSKDKSYSELLREEERATNWFLSGQRVETSIPADSIFVTGEDAPYYRMDKDGYLYMQIVEQGDMEDMAEEGDVIYFRYTSQNIKWLYSGTSSTQSGNSGNLSQSASFVYGNYQLPSSSQYGQGIQIPLEFVGNNSEVNLVLRSYYGFSQDQAECIPNLINIKYFKAEY